jgi:F-type H+-transporting ATPase subunit gamma
MANLKEVRNRITSVISTQQITKAMKMVAAAKLRRAQGRIIDLRPYASHLNGILQNVSAALAGDEISNVYAEEREVENVLVVAITSDRGLCGGFNSNIIKEARKLIAKKYSAQHQAGKVTILPIGKKAFEAFQRQGLPMKEDFYGLQTTKVISFQEVKKAAEFAMDGFVAGDFDAVELVYNEFKNVAVQIIHADQFLPIPKAESTGEKPVNTDYIFEPSKLEIMEELIPKSLKIQFFKSVLESNASEQGARMTAMEQATENAGDLLKELKLTYNRARQANITKEILEIVGGAEAMEQG